MCLILPCSHSKSEQNARLQIRHAQQTSSDEPECAAQLLSLLHQLTQLGSTQAELVLLPQLCQATQTTLTAFFSSTAPFATSQDEVSVEAEAAKSDCKSNVHNGADAQQARHAQMDTVLALLFGLLFQRCSKPMHKQLLSAMQLHLARSPLHARTQPVLIELVQAAASASNHPPNSASNADRAGAPCVATAQAWVSLLAFAPARDALASCAYLGLVTLSGQVHAVLKELKQGLHLTPALTQELQVCSHDMLTWRSGSKCHCTSKTLQPHFVTFLDAPSLRKLRHQLCRTRSLQCITYFSATATCSARGRGVAPCWKLRRTAR